MVVHCSSEVLHELLRDAITLHRNQISQLVDVLSIIENCFRGHHLRDLRPHVTGRVAKYEAKDEVYLMHLLRFFLGIF